MSSDLPNVDRRQRAPSGVVGRPHRATHRTAAGPSPAGRSLAPLNTAGTATPCRPPLPQPGHQREERHRERSQRQAGGPQNIGDVGHLRARRFHQRGLTDPALAADQQRRRLPSGDTPHHLDYALHLAGHANNAGPAVVAVRTHIRQCGHRRRAVSWPRSPTREAPRRFLRYRTGCIYGCAQANLTIASPIAESLAS
jgi:hypothetical protein